MSKHIPTFKEFNESLLYENVNISYDFYCNVLEGCLNESLFSDLKDKAIQTSLKILGPIKEFIQNIVKEFNVGITQVIDAFRQRSVFEFLKAIKFNFRILIRAFSELTSLVRKGLFSIFETLAKTGVINKLREGVIKIDDFLDQYPILKKIGGIVIAGILIYMWLNMTFIGDFDFDFNLGDVVAALSGKFQLADLFLGPSGLILITLFLTGPYISVPWLGSSIYNMAIAVFYTGYVKLKETDMNVMATIKKMVKG